MVDEIIIGKEVEELISKNCIVIGKGASASGIGAIAFGALSQAHGDGALAVGYRAQAIGKGAQAIGDGTTAIGVGAKQITAEFSPMQVQALRVMIQQVFLRDA